ncbi:SRPBCC family protein [Pseudomonas sp. TH41]|uniref:SRPBCC family protein n=1 Tax=Pseudomonas sp. TH41 TaxID=2796405 RepID=UPI00191192F3|nr:SRPBCC family protein [Pseudomonas sp. TH41]MBK5356582.1 SRPBCC family protein [Pseudomonas sp. TH41]
MTFVPPLNQIALSVVDLRLTEHWFREGFGLLPAGGSRLMMRGLLPSRVQGLPKAASTCWWLVGSNPWAQLELFQFENPIARPLPSDFRPCDIGYTRIGLWVADFDETLVRLARLGSQPLSAVQGQAGQRRACVRNPDGVYVEIMEADPLAGQVKPGRDCPAAIRSVTMSVPDLKQTCAFLRNGIGLTEAEATLHHPQHEALWGLPGAKKRSCLFLAGDVLLEVVQYLEPLGKPRPAGYRVCDQGILNIAFGAHNKQDLMTVYRRARAAHARPNCRPVHIPLLNAGVVYLNDAQDFSYEVLWLKPGKADRAWGFEPLPLARRPAPDTHCIEHSVRIEAPANKVWAHISDHEGMAQWSGFKPVTVHRAGNGERNGHGSERLMHGPGGRVVEQVIDWQPPHSLRYRVTEGSPFICHQGEILLRDLGQATELTWRIRFRPKLPGTGNLLRCLLQRMLGAMLLKRLKPLIERC